jgi:hypothetical protein
MSNATANEAAIFSSIASKHFRIETLVSRNSDSLDFHDVSVWQIEAALKAAYQAGLAASKANE